MKVTRIHQIEITSRCNLKCNYCVHKKMKRKKVDMSPEVFERALYCVKLLQPDGQFELNLAGIGESTMHPQFVEMFELARKMLPRTKLVIATNGLLFDEAMADALLPFRPAVWVSLHRPEKAGRAVKIASDRGILHGVSADPSISAMDWAGKVDWIKTCPTGSMCPWLFNGQVMVTAEGDVTTCCLDGDGDGIIGRIDQDPAIWEIKPYSLCKDCHHAIP